MIVKTKKYALDQKTYINIALRQWVKDNWKWAFVPLGLIFLNVVLSLTGVYPNYWIYIVIVLLTFLGGPDYRYRADGAKQSPVSEVYLRNR
jgi:hypothetical protein